MRTSSIYGVSVPELGDRADITVVSDAIISNENNQSGKVENMKATLNSTIIELTSECRTNKLLKYYNGLSIQFVSPVDISAGNSYNIKIDNLAEQPYNNKIDIKLGDVVVAIYGESGFVSYGTTLPRSSSVESDSEVSIANSKAVKTAYDKGVEALDKANTKLDAGSVSTEYNTAEKIEDKIKSSIELANTKLDKGSEDLKLSNAELIVKAIESTQGLKFDTILNIDDVGTKKEGYCYMFEGDIYKCIKQTEATTPESVNFQPISNNKLCDRLDNLIQFINKSDGYVELNDGLMIQWFRASTSTTSVTEVNYPKEFKEGAFQVYATYDHPSTSAMAVAGVAPYTKTSCRVVSRMIAGSGSPHMRFLAIGY